MTSPAHPVICPRCQAQLPEGAPLGLCPACLMDAAGIDSEPVVPCDPFVAPLDLDTLRRAFPQFEILAPIGAGGMGRVYKVRQPSLDRIIALKVLPPDLARNPAWVERFTREARALARLNHPHIVQVYDVGETTGPDVPHLCWLSMEYVDGVTLRQVQRTGGLSVREALAIIPRLCDALQYAHEKGVLHRDIKPENILLDATGAVKIADFGLAKLAGGDSRPDVTQAGARLGTVAYMAPEQIESPGDVDHRADIYSLGVVFYELLTGGLPLGRFPAPSQKSGTDPRLDHIVFRTLENERDRRYQAAGDVRTALESVEASPRPKPVFPTPQDSGTVEKKSADPIPVEPRKPRDRKTSELVPLPFFESSAGPKSRLWVVFAGIILLLITLAWGPVIALLACAAAVLVWRAVCEVRAAARGSSDGSWMAHPGQPVRLRSHGCVALLAFPGTLILFLAPATFAGAAAMSERTNAWNFEWMEIMAGCGVLSYFAVRPLLSLTGMHRGNRVQRRSRLIGWSGAVLCAAAMAGSSLMTRGGFVQELEWGYSGFREGNVNKKDAEAVVEKVFGSAAGLVRVSDPAPEWSDRRAPYGVRIAMAGSAAAGVSDLLLDCAAQLDVLEAKHWDHMQVCDWRVKIGSLPNADMPYAARFWFAGAAVVMAAGAWLLAVQARSSRRRLFPVMALLASGGLAWAVYKSDVSLWGTLSLVDGKVPAFEKRQDFVAAPAKDTPEATVLEWLKAMREGDSGRARKQLSKVSLGNTELDTRNGVSLLNDLKSARVLGLHAHSDGADIYTFCHFVVLRHEKNGPFWETKWMRFRTGSPEGVPQISDISF